MTEDERLAREEIRRTLAQSDIRGGLDDADRYAGAFAEDGVIDSAGFAITGRAEIRGRKAGRAGLSPESRFRRRKA